jgi:hypothetical protein
MKRTFPQNDEDEIDASNNKRAKVENAAVTTSQIVDVAQCTAATETLATDGTTDLCNITDKIAERENGRPRRERTCYSFLKSGEQVVSVVIADSDDSERDDVVADGNYREGEFDGSLSLNVDSKTNEKEEEEEEGEEEYWSYDESEDSGSELTSDSSESANLDDCDDEDSDNDDVIEIDSDEDGDDDDDEDDEALDSDETFENATDIFVCYAGDYEDQTQYFVFNRHSAKGMGDKIAVAVGAEAFGPDAVAKNKYERDTLASALLSLGINGTLPEDLSSAETVAWERMSKEIFGRVLDDKTVGNWIEIEAGEVSEISSIRQVTTWIVNGQIKI